jgi:hypothetical protein
MAGYSPGEIAACPPSGHIKRHICSKSPISISGPVLKGSLPCIYPPPCGSGWRRSIAHTARLPCWEVTSGKSPHLPKISTATNLRCIRRRNATYEPQTQCTNLHLLDQIWPSQVRFFWAACVPNGLRRRSLNNSDLYKSALISKWIGALLAACGSFSGGPSKCGHHSGGRTTEAVYDARFLAVRR